MIKKLLFITTVFIAGGITAQNLDLQDTGNNSIDGKTYYFYDTGANLAVTKLHAANSSASPINFDCRVYEISNATASEWQVCFGTSCYIANDGDPNAQTFSFATAPALGSYNDLKIAPFSFGWVTGDMGVWRVTVVNSTLASDSSSAYVVWDAGGKPNGDANGNGVIDGAEIGGDTDENGSIGSGEITGDMNGNGIIDVWEVSGDANGNGIIDNGEVLSADEITKNNVVFSTYPNPVSSNLTINYIIEGNTDNARVDVYDVLGQKINSYKLTNNKGNLNLNVETLNSGVYFYSIKVDEKTIRTERVIVK